MDGGPVKSQRGGQKMVHKGFSFVRHRELKNGQLVWLCIKRKKGCNAKIYSAGERVVRAEGEHHHPDVLLQESKYSESSSEKSAATTAVQAPSVQAASVQQGGPELNKELLHGIMEAQRKWLDEQKMFIANQNRFITEVLEFSHKKIINLCKFIEPRIDPIDKNPIDKKPQFEPDVEIDDVQEATTNIG
jgi:hypothetical protein